MRQPIHKRSTWRHNHFRTKRVNERARSRKQRAGATPNVVPRYTHYKQLQAARRRCLWRVVSLLRKQLMVEDGARTARGATYTSIMDTRSRHAWRAVTASGTTLECYFNYVRLSAAADDLLTCAYLYHYRRRLCRPVAGGGSGRSDDPPNPARSAFYGPHFCQLVNGFTSVVV